MSRPRSRRRRVSEQNKEQVMLVSDPWSWSVTPWSWSVTPWSVTRVLVSDPLVLVSDPGPGL